MHPLKLVLGFSLATAATLSLTRGTETALDEHLRAEVRRLQAHFDSVDVELKARDVSHLTRAQRASRDNLAAWLRDYREAAAFPLNDGVSLSAVPIFRDSRGVLCAMAYLIDRSGRSDIVDAVAATRNTASIYELADDPRLIAWLDSTGLSTDEAARVQPAYPGDERNSVVVNYAVASVLLSGTALLTLGVNVAGPSRLSGWIGFVAGTVATAGGLIALEQPRAMRRLGALNIGAGTLAMALSLRGIFRSSRPAAPVQVSARLSNVQMAPTVGLLGSPQIGFVMRARF